MNWIRLAAAGMVLALGASLMSAVRMPHRLAPRDVASARLGGDWSCVKTRTIACVMNGGNIDTCPTVVACIESGLPNPTQNQKMWQLPLTDCKIGRPECGHVHDSDGPCSD